MGWVTSLLLLFSVACAGIFLTSPAVHALEMPDSVVIVEVRRTSTATGLDSGAIVLWNPTTADINLSNYFLARYGTGDWNAPADSIEFRKLQAHNRTDSIIRAGGFLRIAVAVGTVVAPNRHTDSDYYWNIANAFTSTNPFAVGLFPFNPGTVTAAAAQAGRSDAVGMGTTLTNKVAEDTNVAFNLTNTQTARRIRLSANNLLFTDTNSNRNEFELIGTNPPALNISSNDDSAIPRLVIAAPTTVANGAAFNLSCTMVVFTKMGLLTDSVVTSYAGTNAWCSITVSSGSVSKESTTLKFTAGKWLDSITITYASSPCTITVRDGAAVATAVVTISNPDGPDTSGFGTCVLSPSSDSPATMGATGQTLRFYLRGTASDTVETASITIPPNIVWSGSSANVALTDDTNAGNINDSVITGTGTSTDSYVITFRRLGATAVDGCTITISSLSYTGGASRTANGLFTFVVRTAETQYVPLPISSSPNIFVKIPAGKVLISEVYNNATDENNGEWLELYNPNSYRVDIANLKIQDDANLDATLPSTPQVMLPYGFYLIADNGYPGTEPGGGGWPAADYSTEELIGFDNTDGGIYIEMGSDTLDAVGWGTTALKETTAVSNALIVQNESIERLSMAAGDSSQHNSTGGNSKDSNQNDIDFFHQATPNPQNSTTQETPAAPIAGGQAVVEPSAWVAKGGRVYVTITYTASGTFSNGRIDIRWPSGWTPPNITDSTAAGFVRLSVINGVIGDSEATSETLSIFPASLTASTGQIYIHYGDTAGGMNALARVDNTVGLDTFYFYASLTDSNILALPNTRPSLNVVTPTTLTLDPATDPQSFIGASYPVTATVTSGGTAVHGDTVVFSIAGDGSDSSLSTVANQRYGPTSSTSITGYTLSDGTIQANFQVSGTVKTNRMSVAPGNVATTTYTDSTRSAIPPISEILWAGTGGSYEYVELYNPRHDTVIMGIQGDSYHVGDNQSISGVASITSFSGVTLGPHRYLVIGQSATIPDVDIVTAGIVLSDGGETVTVYRDTGTVNTVIDQHPVGAWLAGTVDANRRAMERKWVNRTAALAASWNDADSIVYLGGVLHNGTPGLPNSGSLYNSTISASETQTNSQNPESVAITVTLLLNTGDTQPGQPVVLASSHGGDTFTQPGVTNEQGVAVGYLFATTSGTATISVSYPRGVTSTVDVVLDFESPTVPVPASPPGGQETTVLTPKFVWNAASETRTGLWGYQLQLDNDSSFGSPTVDSAAISGTTFTPSSSLAYDTYYWHVRARDGAGNWSAWSSSWSLSVEPATETPLLVNPIATDFENTTTVTVQWTFRDPQSTDTQGWYQVQIDSGTNPDWSNLADEKSKTAGAANQYITASLVNGQWYSVRMRTWDAGGETSAWSDSGAVYILKRIIDGGGADWTSSLPSDSDAAIVANGDYVWRDIQADQRADGTNPDENYDLRRFYATADTHYLYLRFDVTSLTSNTLPYFAIAIDTDRSTSDAALNWIGDQSACVLSVLLGRGAAQYSERNIDMSYDAAESTAFIYDNAVGAWYRPGYRPTYNFYGTAGGIVEYAIPREEAGFALGSTIRVSFLVAENQGAVSDPEIGNATTGGATNNNDALDDIFPGTGIAWNDDLSDSDVDYYVDISFDANGDVAANTAPSAAALTAVSPTNGAEASSAQPAIQWTEATDADGADTRTYWVQISTDNTFATVTQQSTLVWSNSWTPSAALTNDTWYWRVKARDNHGTLSTAWSSTFSFQLRLRGRIDGVADDWFGTPSATVHDTVISEGEFIYTGVSGDQRTDGPADADVDITQFRFSGDTRYLYVLARFQDVTNTDEIYLGMNVDVDRSSGDGALTWLADDATGNTIATAAAYGETNIAMHNSTAGSTKIEMYDQSGAGNAWHAPSVGSSDSVNISTGNNLLEAAFAWRDLSPIVLPQRVRFTIVSYDNNVTWNNAGDGTGNYGTDDGLDVVTPYCTSGDNAWGRDLSNAKYDSYVTVPFNTTGRVNYAPPKPTLSSPADSTPFGDTQASVVMVWVLNDTDGADAQDSAVHVQVSTNTTFTALVVDTTYAGRPTTKTYTLATGANYYWRVRERDDFDTSAYSDSRFFSVAAPAPTDTTPPAKPTGLTALAVVAGAETGVQIRWSNNPASDTIVGYRVYRGAADDSRAATLLLFGGTISDTYKIDTTVLAGDTYYHFVVALDSAGNRSETAGGVTAPHFTTVKIIDSTSLGPKPGSSIQYRLEIVNDGFGPVDAVAFFDTIPANTAYRDTVTSPVGWEFQYCTVAVPNQSWGSADYVGGTPAVPSDVRFIRWRKALITSGEPQAVMRYRVIIQ